jgi:hypothetical protein
MHLNLPDCIYRHDPVSGHPYYHSVAEIFGPPAREESFLPEALADFLDEHFPGGDRPALCGPLAIGGHVDHVLCHRAVRILASRGWTVSFYEDFPYCDPRFQVPPGVDAGTRGAALDRAQMIPRVVSFSEDDLRRKVEAICAYRSQLGALFGAAQDLAALVRSHALDLGSGGPAERFWGLAENRRPRRPARRVEDRR